MMKDKYTWTDKGKEDLPLSSKTVRAISELFSPKGIRFLMSRDYVTEAVNGY